MLWIWSGRVLDSERRVLRILGGTTWSASGERIRVISFFVSCDLEGNILYTWRSRPFGPRERDRES